MTECRLLAISPSSVVAVNRAVYRCLKTQHRLDVHLVVPSFLRTGPNRTPCEEVTQEPFPVTLLEPSGPQNRLLRLRGLSALIARLKPSHVIVETDPATSLVMQALQAAGPGTRVAALTCENLPRDYPREGAEALKRGRILQAASSLVTWWLWRRSHSRLDRLFTISAESTRVMSRNGFAGRITQIPLGFDPGLFFPHTPEARAAVRRKLGLVDPTVAYFGRINREKGVDLLVRALAGLKSNRWQLLLDRFALYQSSFAQVIDEEIERAGIRDRVVFFDASHAEMPEFMNAADVVVLPSISTPKWKEQYGRVIPEAMACGKIVIGSDSGAIPELIADCGFTFPEGSVEGLRDTLAGIFNRSEPGLANLAAKAARRAHSELSILRQAEIWKGYLLYCSPERNALGA